MRWLELLMASIFTWQAAHQSSVALMMVARQLDAAPRPARRRTSPITFDRPLIAARQFFGTTATSATPARWPGSASCRYGMWPSEAGRRHRLEPGAERARDMNERVSPVRAVAPAIAFELP